MDRNAIRMKGPLDGDVAFIAGALILTGALVGTAVGIIIDVLLHRHRR